MSVFFSTGYALPVSDEPLTHARIAHANNWHSDGTISASSTASGFFETAPTNDLTYERWKPASIPANWEQDFGADVPVDYCAIAAHDLGTQGAEIQAQYWDGAAWQTLTNAHSPTDDSAILFIFEPQTAQRFRFRINSVTGDAPYIGVIRFGQALQMQQDFYSGHAPMALARNTVLKHSTSETGEFLGSSKLRSFDQTAFSWEHLGADWVRANWRDFQKAVEDAPFFIAWSPSKFGEVAFCRAMGPMIPQNMGVLDLMSVSFQAKAYAHD